MGFTGGHTRCVAGLNGVQEWIQKGTFDLLNRGLGFRLSGHHPLRLLLDPGQ